MALMIMYHGFGSFVMKSVFLICEVVFVIESDGKVKPISLGPDCF